MGQTAPIYLFSEIRAGFYQIKIIFQIYLVDPHVFESPHDIFYILFHKSYCLTGRIVGFWFFGVLVSVFNLNDACQRGFCLLFFSHIQIFLLTLIHSSKLKNTF